ncbi:MAG TPA: flagellar basal body rod protein FlgB [Accumulibacter sp.]|nr:flagellar basal body rod protein FlgB [Accumulibacter sp.]
MTLSGEVVVVNKLDGFLSFQQQALALRAKRQQVLAGNIANADTPNYKARDFDFQATLQQTLAGRQESAIALATTSPRHLAGTDGSAVPTLGYRQPVQASADGNTVEMDVERTQFAENAFYYEAGLTFITNKIKSMLSAVQGQ